jgi:2-keto-4-pentenoate hydratase/2-oxohepta-3-ene-1,7-dioic acid hydratase in catechol pathway
MQMTKYARFDVNGRVGCGIIQGNTIRGLDGSYLERFRVTSETFDLDRVHLLRPCEPSKVVCVGLNYADHARESKMEIPDAPCLFIKPSTTVIGPGEPVVYPDMSKRVDYEAELAVVVGKTARNIEPEEAGEYIFGYTCLNDVTARDLQQRDGQWTRAKSFDTFCPMGPWIVDNVGDPNNLDVMLVLNNEMRQQSNTSQLVFDVEHLFSFVSKVMTLNAGDVIATGTPAGIGPVQPGDVMEVRIQNIGSLKNPVKR